MVRLVVGRLDRSVEAVSGFNSSVVRLVAGNRSGRISISSFQFQCGAIGSKTFSGRVINAFWFQFQCGAIGSEMTQGTKDALNSFNSSVVRLVGNLHKTVYLYSFVSIPVWCD